MEIRDNGHWVDENYRQRITTAEWKRLLLEGGDVMVFRGRIRQLKAKKLGAGVVEIYKAIRSEK